MYHKNVHYYTQECNKQSSHICKFHRKQRIICSTKLSVLILLSIFVLFNNYELIKDLSLKVLARQNEKIG